MSQEKREVSEFGCRPLLCVSVELAVIFRRWLLVFDDVEVVVLLNDSLTHTSEVSLRKIKWAWKRGAIRTDLK